MSDCTRRVFLAAGPVGVLTAGALASGRGLTAARDADTVGALYPTTESDRARAIVGASHANIDRVRELLAEDPGLSKASWDWGFGDWETAIGAASHTGRTDIIEILLSHGARPTLFTMATLDQVDAVRAVLENVPGTLTLEGPHDITLFNHARAGKAARVMEYLESKGLNFEPQPPIGREGVELYFGRYSWGLGATDHFVVEWSDRMGIMTLKRADGTARGLVHRRGYEFSPVGSRTARVRFELDEGRATRVVVTWSGQEVVASRM